MTNADRKVIKVMFITIVELLFAVMVGPYYAPYFNGLLKMRESYKSFKEVIKDWGEKEE